MKQTAQMQRIPLLLMQMGRMFAHIRMATIRQTVPTGMEIVDTRTATTRQTARTGTEIAGIRTATTRQTARTGMEVAAIRTATIRRIVQTGLEVKEILAAAEIAHPKVGGMAGIMGAAITEEAITDEIGGSDM